MNTSEALLIYNSIYESINKEFDFMTKSELITKELVKKYGEDITDEILDLVYESEF
jgi:hypothetical protein